VGIIANPASGTDIRRLVALGTVFGTQEKINIVQRILAGLHAAEVERFYIMPDAFHIGQRALERLPTHLADLRGQVTILDMAIGHEAEDSWRAAQELQALEVGCLVVLGGGRNKPRRCQRVRRGSDSGRIDRDEQRHPNHDRGNGGRAGCGFCRSP
jgi:predicted polyphosphate/ATP-dependent NAD kinase